MSTVFKFNDNIYFKIVTTCKKIIKGDNFIIYDKTEFIYLPSEIIIIILDYLDNIYVHHFCSTFNIICGNLRVDKPYSIHYIVKPIKSKTKYENYIENTILDFHRVLYALESNYYDYEEIFHEPYINEKSKNIITKKYLRELKKYECNAYICKHICQKIIFEYINKYNKNILIHSVYNITITQINLDNDFLKYTRKYHEENGNHKCFEGLIYQGHIYGIPLFKAVYSS